MNIINFVMDKQPQLSKVLERRDAFRSKWLGVKYVDYEIGGRRINNYEMVFRSTTEDKNLDIDGVDIIPIIKYKEKPSQLLLIANFRPPAGKFVLEFPAGLLDHESIEVPHNQHIGKRTKGSERIDRLYCQSFLGIPITTNL